MKHLPISIILSTTILTGWLFYNTKQGKDNFEKITYSRINSLETELQKQRAETRVSQERIEALLSKLNKTSEREPELSKINNSKYSIFTMELGGLPRTFLLNAETGESWRYYISSTDGKIESEGWGFLKFTGRGLSFVNPDDAIQYIRRILQLPK